MFYLVKSFIRMLAAAELFVLPSFLMGCHSKDANGVVKCLQNNVDDDAYTVSNKCYPLGDSKEMSGVIIYGFETKFIDLNAKKMTYYLRSTKTHYNFVMNPSQVPRDFDNNKIYKASYITFIGRSTTGDNQPRVITIDKIKSFTNVPLVIGK